MIRFLRNAAFAAFVLAAAAQHARAADPAPCGELPCRADGTPYVDAEGRIIILVNEKFFVELHVEGDKVVRATPRKSRVPNSIELLFNAVGSARGLVWVNYFGKPIMFDIETAMPRREVLPAKPCAVGPNRSSYEAWESDASGLILSNFRIAAPTTTLCK